MSYGRWFAMVLGLVACATPASGETLRREAAGYELEVLVDGVPVPTFAHAGGTYLLGQLGDRYTLRVSNRTGRRVEAVVSVDGRDVLDGRPADVRKRGYLVPAWGTVDIDGWRLSTSKAAAFRFSTVPDSYAARTGNAREVGVIGVAVFPERVQPRPWPSLPYSSRAESEDRAPAPAAAPSAEAPARSGAGKMAERRRGLGTEFGEEVDSAVHQVAFERANPTRPALVLGARYDDRAGLMALGIDVDGNGYGYDDAWVRQTARPFPVVQRGYASPPPGWRR
jgi:hypothetical protein